MRNGNDDMSGCTESLPLKLTIVDKSDLSMIAAARGDTAQNVAREFIHQGIQRVRMEYTLAAKLLRGEEIVSESRGSARESRS